MRRNGLLCIIVVLVLSSLTLACAQPAPAPSPSPAPAPAPKPSPAPSPAAPPAPAAPKAVELTMWSGWAPHTWTTKPYMFWFIDRVNTGGKAVNISIKYLGGPEVFPTNEGMESLRKGLVDSAYTTTAYHVGQVPASDAMKLSRIQPWDERTTGAYDMMNKWHQEKVNAFYSWRLPHDGYFTFYMNVDRDKPDMKGLKIRTTPIYMPIIKALGGTPVSTTPDEVYTALERKIVDGYGWAVVGITDRKWEEVTKFKWGPPFYASPTGVWYNLTKWNSLDPKQREFLTKMAMDSERDALAMWEKDQKNEVDVLAKANIKHIKFSAADEKMFLDLAYEEGWKDVISKAAESAQFRPLLEKKK